MFDKDKIKRFAEARVSGKTPEEAAVHAGFDPKHAALVGAQLLGNPEVIEIIANHKPAEVTYKKPMPPLPGTPEASGALPSPCGDPMKMLESIMDNTAVDIAKRMEAAKILMPFKYNKLGEVGKKAELQNKATKTGAEGNKFSPGKAPTHLRTVK